MRIKIAATLLMFGISFSVLVADAPKADRKKTTQFTIERGELRLPAQVVFETGSDKIDEAESAAPLELMLDFLEAKKDISLVRIEGHTDASGKLAENQSLSERRALAVAKWLVAHGADCKRLIAVGFGQTKPVAANDTPVNKAANRRISVMIAGMRGKLIGGMPADGGGQVAGDPCK